MALTSVGIGTGTAAAAGANAIDSLTLTLGAIGSAAAGAIGHAFAIGRFGTKILFLSPENWNDN